MFLFNHKVSTFSIVIFCNFVLSICNVIKSLHFHLSFCLVIFSCFNVRCHYITTFWSSSYSNFEILCCYVCNDLCYFCSCDVYGLFFFLCFWCWWCPFCCHHYVRVRSCEVWEGTSKFINRAWFFFLFFVFCINVFCYLCDDDFRYIRSWRRDSIFIHYDVVIFTHKVRIL